ncbi:hypothetical protein [Pontibacter beigongshangensis]|uniref:hypothetical protein n=1 Tax=Pontibacter beigongshangensis TaxID=2574733 RepID=UPI001650C6B7|nr:hypothetical protein [Pontibacter beigongshangensis]
MDEKLLAAILGGAIAIAGGSLIELLKSYGNRKHVKFAAFYSEQAKVLIYLYSRLSKANRELELLHKLWLNVNFLENGKLGDFVQAANILQLKGKFQNNASEKISDIIRLQTEIKSYFEDNAIYFDESFSKSVYSVVDVLEEVRITYRGFVNTGSTYKEESVLHLDVAISNASKLMSRTLKTIRKKMREVLSN